MSVRKFSFKDLAKWRRMQLECIDQPLDKNTPFPVDWCEFNKMFSSKRNVIVEYPSQKYSTATQMLMGFYSSIKMAKDNACVGICDHSRNGFPGIRSFAKKLSNKNMDDNVVFISSITPFQDYRNRVLECDEWILNADWSILHPGYPPDEFSCDGGTIFKAINDTRGFSELDVNEELWNANRTLMGWEDKEKKRLNRRFVIMWDDRGKDALADVMANYPDQFLVIPYTKEKHMVDKWYESNETMVDPGFDIQLMDGSLDKRKVLLYAATNHPYDFRLFAKVLPDVVEKYITKAELRYFGV